MASSKDKKRVALLLVGAIFINFFLIINSVEYRTAGIVFLAMAVFGWFVFKGGKLV